MRFKGRAHIETLARFKGQGELVTSFYLNADKGRLTKKEIQLALKNLLNDARGRLEGLSAGREKEESLGRDLTLIEAFASRSLASSNAAGLAAFSCSRRDFWLDLELPHGPRNRIVFDTNFYVRPLSAILDKRRSICVVVLDRREARWYEVSMGEIRPAGELRSDVPARVKEGGFEGTEGKRIERRLDARLQDHLKRTAAKTADLHKSNGFDRLFLGGDESLGAELEDHLPKPLRDKIGARLKVRLNDAPAKVLKEALSAEASLSKADEEGIVQKLVAELERGGLAASGLRDTIHRLNQFEIQTLVVTHNLSRPGRICPTHGFFYLEELQCPICGKKTDIVRDVVDEAIETVLKRGGTVKHITPPSKLDRYGEIGAFLKYKA
jgi:peptide subunit release factor 1 (eRF1)